jgi:hypothetical protein
LFTSDIDIANGGIQDLNLDYFSGTRWDAEILDSTDTEFALLDDGWETFDLSNAQLAESGSSCAAEVSQSYGKGKRFVCPVPESDTEDATENTAEDASVEIPALPDISALEVMLEGQKPKDERKYPLPGDIPFTPRTKEQLCGDGYVALCCEGQEDLGSTIGLNRIGLTQTGCEECKHFISFWFFDVIYLQLPGFDQ